MRPVSRVFLLLVALVGAALALAVGGAGPAVALDPVSVKADGGTIDLLRFLQRSRSDGDQIQISTAPGPDGIVRRIAIKAKEEGTRPDWIVFALRNESNEQLVRWLIAPHFRLVDSGVVWPDLGARRITAVTASQGESPEREESPEADIFEIVLDPGATVTYIAELANPKLPQLYLWHPDEYKDKLNGLTLYRGIVIGIAGLLALFLTIVFVVKGAVIFPAAAALAWAVLAYICIDFGFWQKIVPTSPEGERVYRATAEAVLAATLVVFLFAYLNLNRWHVRYVHVTAAWLVFLAALIGLAVIDPSVASGVARISIAVAAAVGFLLVIYLSTHGYDRAVLLTPTWFLLLAWVIAAAFAIAGRSPTTSWPRPARRARPHRHADRLHRDAARLRRRGHRAGPRQRCRAQGAGAGGLRRQRVRLGRDGRPHRGQRRDRGRARPAPRHAGGRGGELARS